MKIEDIKVGRWYWAHENGGHIYRYKVESVQGAEKVLLRDHMFSFMCVTVHPENLLVECGPNPFVLLLRWMGFLP